MRYPHAPIALLLFFCVSCDPGETTTILDQEMPDGDALADCPADMAPVGGVCVDKYEASRGDATADNAGDDETVARSVAGVLPWMVNPMTTTELAKFKSACVAAGKRLCSVGEWTAACEGPEKNAYHFGNTFDRETCNCVDTFCDDFCAEHNIAVCNTDANCGYEYECFHVMPTGSFPDCTAGDGFFDVNGNVWEVVDNGSGGFLIKGGAFNCASAADRLKCSFSAGWTELYAGFRCCKGR
ncbi:MAG TPA: SUMF1/EgtB/PvdO family nonheme iron enzyme [bacterium]|nr:SUMF1/EgtB/PvdO family nonheme iron enzyme [bacterium]